MKNTLLYPWLSIWRQPIKTLRYMRRYPNMINLGILMIITVWLSSYNIKYIPSLKEFGFSIQFFVGIILTIIDIFIVFVLARLFKGRATLRDITIVMLLSSMPLLLTESVYMILIDPVNENNNLWVYGVIFILSIIWTYMLFINMLSKISYFSKWIGGLVVLVYTIIYVIIYGLAFTMQPIVKEDFNTTAYLTQIDKLRDENKSNTLVTGFISAGYDNVVDNPTEFKLYNNGILQRFFVHSWKNKSIQTNSNLWIDTLSKKSFKSGELDPFIEQLEALDGLATEENKTKKELSQSMALSSIEFMDNGLQKLLESNVTVPLVTLYTLQGKLINEMNSSRKYYVSEVYKNISDFCDEAENIVCDPEAYIQKAVQASALNPNALFLYAYHSDDHIKNVDYLERVLKLTQKSDALLNHEMSAIYNNLGYQIWEADLEAKYDDAIEYLQKAYDLDNESVYSLVTQSAIYRYKKLYKKSYESLEKEVYNFMHASDAILEDKENNYWLLARHLIDISYKDHDYNTMRYACKRYLKLHDEEYEECHTYLKEIEIKKELNATAPYTFWELYSHPEIYQAQKIERGE